jgi:ubiquinone/menaquinone biosynthesis C-methylase UbiE
MSVQDLTIETKLPPAGSVFYRSFTHLNLRRWAECTTLIEWLDPHASERILDIGCGDGWWDHRIARRGAHVVGVDVSERALALAEQKNKCALTEFHKVDAENLPFESSSFDKAVSMCVIEHFQDEDRVLSEVARVLKPGAPFILSADSLTNPGIRQDELSRHRTRYAVNTFYTIDLLRKKLDSAGFDLEHAHYILTTPTSLSIVRASWALDDLSEKGGLKSAFSEVGYFVLNTLGRRVAELSEKLRGRKDNGLTILARARKRA